MLGKHSISNQERHKRLWAAVFSDFAWLDHIEQSLGLNPVLIGRNLDVFGGQEIPRESDQGQIYMALLSGDTSGNIRHTRSLFFKCLRPNAYVEGALDVSFENGITLNIFDILSNPEVVPVDSERLLFDNGQFSSSYSFWKDSRFSSRPLGAKELSIAKPKCGSSFWLQVASFTSPDGDQKFDGWFRDMRVED